MKRVLVTGMSGVGKSSAVDELRRRGYKTVDTDCDDLTVTTANGETRWDEPRIQRLLSTDGADLLFISGTAENMGKFRPQFDHVILLSAPPDVMAQRLTTRTNNPYGQRPDQLAESLHYKDTVEPQLRQIATIEIDTTVALDRHHRSAGPDRRGYARSCQPEATATVIGRRQKVRSAGHTER